MENNYIFWDGSNPDYTIESDLWGNIKNIVNSKNIRSILGYEEDEYKIINQITLIHPEALLKLIKDIQIIYSSIKSGKYYGILPIKHKDGMYKNIQFIAEYDINANQVFCLSRFIDDGLCSIIYPLKQRKTRSDKGKIRKRNEIN
tara:strand:- start:280 stop:714 length:435 start_codon:yes stop_codon:yes gene_type:complete